jgi:hypothetical protein
LINILQFSALKRLILLIWLSVLIASTFGAVSVILALLKFEDVPGPTGPGVGAALLYGIIILIICVGLIIICCCYRPPADVRTKGNIFLSLLVIVATVGGFSLMTHKTQSKTQRSRDYTIEIRLLDKSDVALSSATVSYYTLTDGEGRQFFSGRDISQTNTTDRDGTVSIAANQVQSYTFHCNAVGFETATIQLWAIYGPPPFNLHQLNSRYAEIEFPPNAQDIKSRTDRGDLIQECHIPPSKTIRLTAKLHKSLASFVEIGAPTNNLITGKVRSPLDHRGAESRINLDFKNQHKPIVLTIKNWTADRTDQKPVPDWRVEIESENGELQAPDENNPFEAPATGYTNTLTWQAISTDPKWTPDFDKFIYFQTDDGMYGRVHVNFTSWYGDAKVEYALDPTGTRSLGSSPLKSNLKTP